MSLSHLLSPFSLGPVSLSNRAVMAPMTRNRSPETIPLPITETYYAQRASVGLIITEGAQVSPQGVGYPGTPGIHTEAQVEAWKRVTDAVHAKGGKIFLQLWHVGRASHPSLQPGGALPVSSSAVAIPGQTMTLTGLQPFVAPRALETDEIPGVVAQFAHGAKLSKEAGFDGVEIHGANGYLVDQFLRDGVNQRTDAYGGTLQNRLRFLREVVEAVAGAWSADRVGVRISPWGTFNGMSDSDPRTTFLAAAELLSAYGLSYLHIIEGVPGTQMGGPVEGRLARDLKAAFKGVTILNGGYSAEAAEQLITSGEADLVSFGVPLIGNPDFIERVQRGAALTTPDFSKLYGGGAEGYIDYPSL